MRVRHSLSPDQRRDAAKKIDNLLIGLDAVAPGTTVVVFVDSDVRAGTPELAEGPGCTAC